MSATSRISETALPSATPVRMGNWRQFSLRSLLLFTLATSLLMAWVAHQRLQAAQQQAAWRLIVAKRAGTNFGPESARPGWLRWILGDDVAADGGCIDIGVAELTDADVATLSALRNLQIMSLHGNPITDQGLVHLIRFPKLRNLNLWKTNITDAGLETIRACKSLEWVSFEETQVSSAAIQKLRTARPGLTIVDASGDELPPLDPTLIPAT